MPKGKVIKVPEHIKSLMKQNKISKETFYYRTRIQKPPMNMYEAATTPLKRNGEAVKYGKALAIADKKGLSRATFYSRIHSGVPPMLAATLEPDNHRVLTDDEIATAKSRDLSLGTVRRRIEAGWSREDAVTVKSGERKALSYYSMLASQNDVPLNTFYARVNHDWDKLKAATYPSGSLEYLTLEENKIMIARGLHHTQVNARIKAHNWSVEKALMTDDMLRELYRK